MKMKQTYLLLFAFILMAFTAAGQGAIKGRVLDENNLGMPGANIFIESIMTGTITDVNGEFILQDIPEGDYTLLVSFIGYADQNIDVSVSNNKTSEVRTSLEPGVMLGDEILILGDRLKGQAKALNQQKNNMNITNIVASDQLGRFPDANVGDALKRIPGITMQNDQGEARDIIVRGLAPQLNSVTINGERIPSAEGDNRRVQMDLIPSDMIQLIEVNKALTPDMDADAIGGSVNLVTRSAPGGSRISGTLASGYNGLSGKPIWTGAFIYGDRFFNNKLGAVLSVSYNNHNFGSDNIEAEWVEDDNLGPVIDEYQLRTYKVQRVRRSFSLGLDYEINPNHTLYLSGMYNWRDDWENRYVFAVTDLGDAFENGDISAIAPNQYQGIGTVERETKAGLDTDRIKSRRLEDQRMANISLRGEHLLGDRFKLNWSGTYSRASEDRPNERYMQYALEYDEDDVTGVPVYIDLRDTRNPFATSTQENQYQLLELDELTEETQETWEEDRNIKIDLQYTLGSIGILKGGFTYRDKTKKRDNNFFEYSPMDGNDIELLGSIPVTNESRSDFLVGERYQAGNFASADYIGSFDLTDGTMWEQEDLPSEYAADNYTANETVTAGYLMTDLQLSNKLSTIVGIRLENTALDYTGFALDEENEDILGTVEGENNYTNILPGIHLKYDFTPNSVLRFAWTNTLARPNYFDLVPYQAYNPDDEELVEGNPDLKPLRSMNFDIMYENYFKSIGLVSAGAFYKDIKDFIYERTFNNFEHPTFGTVDYTSFRNGESASVYGFEAAFQRQLDFLPGFWKGFGLYLNYTHTQTSTEGIEGREGEDIALPGSAENMFNASLSYETDKLVLRVSVNHTSDYIDELGGEAFEDRFYDQQTFLDFNGSYAFTKNWRFFVEANNLTNQPLRYYQGVESQTMQAEFYSFRLNAGFKFDFFQ
jgi:TonB-dependent receptor